MREAIAGVLSAVFAAGLQKWWDSRKKRKRVRPCPGALNIQGANYPCEEDYAPHEPLACHNREAEAIWK